MAFTTASPDDELTSSLWNEVVNALNGTSQASPVSLTAFSSASLYTLTVRNQGSGGLGLRVLSSSGSNVLTVTDTGVSVAGTFTAPSALASSALVLTQIATPSAPSAGSDEIYFKSDDNLYKQTPGSDEVRILDADIFTAAGQLIYATGAEAFTQLAAGTAFQELTMNSGATAPQWSNGPRALVTTAGDMTYASAANTLARLAAGAATQVLHGGTTPSWGSIATGDIAANAITQSGVTTTGAADSTNSTSFVDMSGLSVTLTTVGGDVLVFAVGAYTHSGASQNVQVGFQVDSVATVSGPAVHSNTTVGAAVLWANTHIFTGLSATAHSFKSRWLTSAGTVTGYGGRTIVAIELKR